MTKINSALPKSNGLDPIAQDMIDFPSTPRMIVGIVDCKSFTTDTDTGDQEATVRVRQIEVVEGDDRRTLGEILRRAKETRTGALSLPLDTTISFNGVEVDGVEGLADAMRNR